MKEASIFEMVEEFHHKYKQPTSLPMKEEDIKLRATLVQEEASEFQEEIMNLSTNEAIDPSQINKEAVTKELADILYVTIGSAVTWGLPLEEVFKRVHLSNMSKNGGFRSDGKVLKGSGYQEPNLKDLF